jgi:hypothetical protein
VLRLALQLEVVHEYKLAVEDAEDIGACLEEVVLLLSGYVDYLLDAVVGARIDDAGDLVFVGDLGIGR